MADQADVEELDELDLGEDGGGEDIQSDTNTGDDTTAGADGEDELGGGDADDELEISFDGEAAPASKGDDSGLVKQLRAEIRKRDQLLAARPQAAPQAIEVGDKPTLETCDYDEAKFETDLDAWKERKAQAEAQATEAQKSTQAQQAQFAEKLGEFARNKQALGARDFNAAEETAVAGLSEVQQAIVVKAAANSAAVIYALGKHPAKLATLAAIEDPIAFTAAVVRLEGKLSVTKRTRTPPEPDTPAKGGAAVSPGQAEKHLERLEKEAARTGNRTPVIQYKRQLRAQGKS